MRIVMFGHSYLLVIMSRAAAAHSSPRRKFGCVLSLGWLEKRADTAHTESTRTGGKAPALQCILQHTCKVRKLKRRHKNSPQLPHVTRFVENMVRLAIEALEENFSKMFLDFLRRQRIPPF